MVYGCDETEEEGKKDCFMTWRRSLLSTTTRLFVPDMHYGSAKLKIGLLLLLLLLLLFKEDTPTAHGMDGWLQNWACFALLYNGKKFSIANEAATNDMSP